MEQSARRLLYNWFQTRPRALTALRLSNKVLTVLVYLVYILLCLALLWQRDIRLARVLAGQAELLLMDEPFASLDFLTRAELQSQLLTIQEKLPRTIVLVTHQLEEALLLGRRIIVMHPDSTICEFDLTDSPYPRDLDDPTLRRLKEAITDQCRYTA